jgi:hypothetical protein
MGSEVRDEAIDQSCRVQFAQNLDPELRPDPGDESREVTENNLVVVDPRGYQIDTFSMTVGLRRY